MIDNLLTTSFASDLTAGVFLYLQKEKRFTYVHYIKRDKENTEVYFAHTEVDGGMVQVDVFVLDNDAIVDFFQPCQILYN